MSMTLQEAIIQMVQKPYLVAMRPPSRIFGFNPSGSLVNFALGPRAYARLNMQDFLVDIWELLTPEELAAAATAIAPTE